MTTGAASEGRGDSPRAQVNLDLRGEERDALTTAASACGITTPALARAIVRSWLAHPWNHPAEIVDHDHGDGISWDDVIGSVRASTEWLEGTARPAEVFTTLIGRLDRVDLLGVALGLIAQLSDRDRDVLRIALTAEKRT